MPRVVFTPNLQRHARCDPRMVEGFTVREALKAALRDNPRALGYILDDQGALRRNMVIFVNGSQIRDREGLSDPLPEGAEVYVMQALSGG